MGLKLRFSCISVEISVNYQKRIHLTYWWGGIFFMQIWQKNHCSYRNMVVKVYFSGAKGTAKFFTPLKTIYVQIFDLPQHQISDGGACPPSIPKAWGMPLQQKFLKSVAAPPPNFVDFWYSLPPLFRCIFKKEFSENWKMLTFGARKFRKCSKIA